MQALILLDLQNDYGAFGALPIQDAEQSVPTINLLMEHFSTIVATKDWHPANHLSFAANHPWRHPEQIIKVNDLDQKLSIIHCVQDSFGAEFIGGLKTSKIDETFLKGTDKNWGSYSGFYDNNQKRSTGMGEWLKEKGVKEVFIVGLNIENSVKATVLDAINLGFKTHFIQDASKGVSNQEIEEMIQNGVLVD